MESRLKLMIICLAAFALISFAITSPSFAKSRDRGGRAGDREGGGRGAHRSVEMTDETAADSDNTETSEGRSGRAEPTGGSVGDEKDETTARERHHFRKHRHGGDGEISEQDAVDRAEKRAERVFADLDDNDDGVVDADEISQSADEKAQSLYDRLADRYGEVDGGVEIDADSRLASRLGEIAADGLITAEELTDATQSRLNALDLDEDGSITAQEVSDFFVDKATERFDERDTNDDGVINRDDRKPEEESDEEEDPAEE